MRLEEKRFGPGRYNFNWRRETTQFRGSRLTSSTVGSQLALPFLMIDLLYDVSLVTALFKSFIADVQASRLGPISDFKSSRLFDLV